jgi:hypothetical protein
MVWWNFGGEVEEEYPPPLARLCALAFFEKWGGCQAQSRKRGEILFSKNTRKSLSQGPLSGILSPSPDLTTTMKKIEVTGSTTIGNILSEYGKIVDTGKVNSITFVIDVSSKLEMVKKSAVVSRADTETALAKLSATEREVIKKFQALEKTLASKRVQGEESQRWKSQIAITAQ